MLGIEVCTNCGLPTSFVRKNKKQKVKQDLKSKKFGEITFGKYLTNQFFFIYTGCARRTLLRVGRSHHFQQGSMGHCPNFGFVSEKRPKNHL
jgi:hypothetical protein